MAEESSAATQEVSAAAEETSAAARHISASSQELAATAQSLERLVSHFRPGLTATARSPLHPGTVPRTNAGGCAIAQAEPSQRDDGDAPA